MREQLRPVAMLTNPNPGVRPGSNSPIRDVALRPEILPQRGPEDVDAVCATELGQQISVHCFTLGALRSWTVHGAGCLS